MAAELMRRLPSKSRAMIRMMCVVMCVVAAGSLHLKFYVQDHFTSLEIILFLKRHWTSPAAVGCCSRWRLRFVPREALY